jgi:hypothetical protein
MVTHEEAVAHKEAAAGRSAAEAAPGAVWRQVIEPDPGAAVNFVNLSPAQQAGEVSMTNRADGQVDVYFFL